MGRLMLFLLVGGVFTIRRGPGQGPTPPEKVSSTPP